MMHFFIENVVEGRALSNNIYKILVRFPLPQVYVPAISFLLEHHFSLISKKKILHEIMTLVAHTLHFELN